MQKGTKWGLGENAGQNAPPGALGGGRRGARGHCAQDITGDRAGRPVRTSSALAPLDRVLFLVEVGLGLEGDLRQKLILNGMDLLNGESFLSGEFIAENEGDYTEEDNLIFILHKESIEEKAKVQISCIRKESADNYRKTLTLSAD